MKQLLKEAGLKLLLATGIFAIVVIFLMWQGLTSQYFALEIIAGIIGSAYVLVVKNPNNYLGFGLGILMSILLGIQFFLQGSYDQTILYYCVFIPCQVFALATWIKGSKKQDSGQAFAPSFLSLKGMLTGLCIFAAIILADLYLLLPNVKEGFAINLGWIMSAVVVGASTMANFLMIKKKTDTWIYWMIFSFAGVIQLIYFQVWVTLTLFVMYIFINGSACIAWCKGTTKENRGWVNTFCPTKK